MDQDLFTILRDRIERLPDAAQREVVNAMLEVIKKHEPVYQLSDDERAAVEEGLAQADRGELISIEEMPIFRD